MKIDQNIEAYINSGEVREMIKYLNEKSKQTSKVMRRNVLIVMGIVVLLIIYGLQNKNIVSVLFLCVVLWVVAVIYVFNKKIAERKLEAEIMNKILPKFFPDMVYGINIEEYWQKIKNIVTRGVLREQKKDIKKKFWKGPAAKMMYRMRGDVKIFTHKLRRKKGAGKAVKMIGFQDKGGILFEKKDHYMNYMFFFDDKPLSFTSMIQVIPGGKSNKDKVGLENLAFEERYDVLSDDHMDARVVITPNVMQAILDMDNQQGTKIERVIFTSKIVIIRRKMRGGFYPNGSKEVNKGTEYNK